MGQRRDGDRLHGRQSAGALADVIAQTGATLFAAVPGVYRQILKYAKPDA